MICFCLGVRRTFTIFTFLPNNHGSVDNLVIGSDDFRFSFQKWAIVLTLVIVGKRWTKSNKLNFATLVSSTPLTFYFQATNLFFMDQNMIKQLIRNVTCELYSEVKVTT